MLPCFSWSQSGSLIALQHDAEGLRLTQTEVEPFALNV